MLKTARPTCSKFRIAGSMQSRTNAPPHPGPPGPHPPPTNSVARGASIAGGGRGDDARSAKIQRCTRPTGLPVGVDSSGAPIYKRGDSCDSNRIANAMTQNPDRDSVLQRSRSSRSRGVLRFRAGPASNSLSVRQRRQPRCDGRDARWAAAIESGAVRRAPLARQPGQGRGGPAEDVQQHRRGGRGGRLLGRGSCRRPSKGLPNSSTSSIAGPTFAS